MALPKIVEINPAELTNRGVDLYNQGNFKGALALFNQAIKLIEGGKAENYPAAYYHRGYLYLNAKGLQNYENAVSDFTKSLESDPMNARTYLERGHAYEEIGKGLEKKVDEAVNKGKNKEAQRLVDETNSYYELAQQDYDKRQEIERMNAEKELNKFWSSPQDNLKTPVLTEAQTLALGLAAKYDMPDGYGDIVRKIAEKNPAHADEIVKLIKDQLLILCGGQIEPVEDLGDDYGTVKVRKTAFGIIDWSQLDFKEKEGEDKIQTLWGYTYALEAIIGLDTASILPAMQKFTEMLDARKDDFARMSSYVSTVAWMAFDGERATEKMYGALVDFTYYREEAAVQVGITLFERLARSMGNTGETQVQETAKKMEMLFSSLGINHFYRYPPELLIETYRTMSEKGYYKEGDYLGVVLYPKDDHSKVYLSSRSFLSMLQAGKHKGVHWIVCEAEGEAQFLKRVINNGFLDEKERKKSCVVDRFSQYDAAIIAGHGNRWGITFRMGGKAVSGTHRILINMAQC